MAMPSSSRPSLDVLHNLATQLRIDSVRSTSAAGSGHPTTCLSAADIVAALFFAEMRFDPADPQHPGGRSVRAVEGTRGANSLRRLGGGRSVSARRGAQAADDRIGSRRASRRRGSRSSTSPRDRWDRGFAAGVGIALNARRIESDYRTYVLLGDGECAEGSVWEAAEVAAHERLDNLCAIIDVNGLGQSRATQYEHDTDSFVRRFEAFGWWARSIDGHDMGQILAALDEARKVSGRPALIAARTLKGKGLAAIEGKPGWHGKALKKGEETDKAIAELEAQYVKTTDPAPVIPKPATAPGRIGAGRLRGGDACAIVGARATRSPRARRSGRHSSRSVAWTAGSWRSTPT